jgi:hypothetical protein
MSEPRKVDFRAEYVLRTRTINLLQSSAAHQVEFIYQGMYFSGWNFEGVAALMKANAIGFRTEHVPEHAGAAYRPENDLNLIDVPTYDFGKDPADSFGRYALIHESVHAWYDIEMDGPIGVWEEAIAYIAGTLFSLYYEPRTGPGKTPTVPSWASSSVYATAFRISLALMGNANSMVPATEVVTLEAAIKASASYPKLKADPYLVYTHNGVSIP